MRVLLIAWLLVFLAVPSLAQDVVSMKKDERAPHAGLLVKESRFTKLLEAEMDVEDLKGQLEIQRRLTSNLESMYTRRIEEAVNLKWYEKPSFNRWLGFGIGIIVTGLAVLGGAQLVKAVK